MASRSGDPRRTRRKGSHRYWVKPGSLPEAVDVPDVVLQTHVPELAHELSEEAARVLSDKQLPELAAWRTAQQVPPSPERPVQRGFRTRVEIEATLTEEDSIVAGFDDPLVQDALGEHGPTEDTVLDRGGRSGRRKKRPLAQPWSIGPYNAPGTNSASRPERLKAAPPERFTPARRPKHPARKAMPNQPPAARPATVQATVMHEDTLSVHSEDTGEVWHSLATADLVFDPPSDDVVLDMQVAPVQRVSSKPFLAKVPPYPTEPAPLALPPRDEDDDLGAGWTTLFRALVVGITLILGLALGAGAFVGAYLLATDLQAP